MSNQTKNITEFYEVICDEGVIKFEDFKKAQEKLKRVYQSEAFGYIVKKELNVDGEILSETFIG